MKVAICDDDMRDLARLEQFCLRFDNRIPIGRFTDGMSLLKTYEYDFYDLVFLDIEMSAPNGLIVGKELAGREVPPLIVFTTQSLNYAVRGYGIAMRYLPKPVEFDTFSGVMRMAMEKIAAQKLTISCGGTTVVLPICDISYFEVIHHEVIFHMKDSRIYSTRGSLTDFMDKLARFWFIQPHKSYCVNMDHIDRLTRQTITMTNGEIVPIGRSMRDSFHHRFDLYLKGNSTL